MRWLMHTAAAAQLLALAACSGSGNGDATTAVTGAQELCVASSCGQMIELADLPGAENIQFTPDGRLFVSGAEGVFEVTRDAAGTWRLERVTDEACGAAGLAIRDGILYANCGGGVFAGRLATPTVLTRIFDYAGMCIPNGMALGADGNLYVVDEPLKACVPDPKIVRLTIDPADPLRIVAQDVWLQGSAAGQLHLGLDNVLRFPNGLQSKGRSFFGTDGGSVYRVDLLPDGSAGEVMPLFWEPVAHDDLGIAGDDLTVTDFFTGRIFLLSQEGKLIQETDRGIWVSPSCARVATGPMFEPGDIVVTSQGVLGDSRVPVDKLTVFRRRR